MSESKKTQDAVKLLAPGEARSEGGEAEVVTIEEHGARTIAGTPVEVQFRGSSVLLRRELGMISARRDLKQHPGKLHLMTLATCIEFIGGKDLRPMSDDQKVTVLADELTFGDVGYLTTYRAFERSGQRFKFPWSVTCQGCGETMKAGSIEIDLASLKLARFAEPPSVRYRLSREWKMGPDLITEVVLGPPSARRALLEVTAEEWEINDLAEIREVSASITHMTRKGPDGTERTTSTVVTPAMLNGMHEDDFDVMVDAVRAVRGGTARSVEWTHEVCGRKSLLPLDWKSDFFGS